MDNFYTIRFKRKTAKRFKHFSKKVTKSYSETMEMVINFFEWHGFSPSDRFERSLLQEIIKNRKRTEASIAIIRDIEKQQTKPTNAMLMSLFEENLIQDDDNESNFVEKMLEDTTAMEDKPVEDMTVPKIRYKRLEDKMHAVKTDFNYVLNKVKIIKSSFGKGHLKLELTEEELIKFKRTLKNL